MLPDVRFYSAILRNNGILYENVVNGATPPIAVGIAATPLPVETIVVSDASDKSDATQHCDNQ